MKSDPLLRLKVRRRRPRLESLERRHLLAVDGMLLVADNVSVEQNSAATTISVLANDAFGTDYTGNRKITAVSTGSLGGRIEIIEDGNSLRYTPPADVDGVETFRYTVDGLQSAETRVRIASPLPAFHETVYLFRDEYRFDVLRDAIFSEDYSGEKRITLVSDSSNGADVRISDDGTAINYRSRIGIQGIDRFNYVVDDRFLGTAVIEVVNPIKPDQYEVIQKSAPTRLAVLENDFLSADFLSDDLISGTGPEFDAAATAREARITHVLSDSEDFDVSIADDDRSIIFSINDQPSDHYGYASFRYVVNGRFETSVGVSIQRPVRDDYFNADINGGRHRFDVLTNDAYFSINGSTVRIANQVTSVTPGDQGGTVEIAENGQVVNYTPAEGFMGTETFSYVANDRYAATVSVSVTSPVRDDHFVAFVGSNNRLDVLKNDFAGTPMGDVVITSVTESAAGASIAIDPHGSIIYTPPLEILSGDAPIHSDVFTYTVNDSLTATAHVQFAKITASDWYEVDRPIQRTLDVLGNDHFDRDYPGRGIITSVSNPSAGGLVSIASDGRSLIYQPGADHESITYTVDDQFIETVQVTPIRRLASDHAVTDQNGQGIVIDVKGNDFANHDYILRTYGPYLGSKIVTDVSASTHGGEVTITHDGQVRYVPSTDFTGRDSFTYTIDDFLTEQVFVNVIRRVNDDSVHVASGKTESLNVLSNDILGADYEGNGLITSVTPSSIGAEILVAADGRSIQYTAPSGWTGQDSFEYSLDGQFKATVKVSIHTNQGGSRAKFGSIEELRDHLLGISIERYQSQFGQIGYEYPGDFVTDSNPRNSIPSDAPNFSETNVQVAGVDEDDIVETDGHYIYSLRGDELAIVQSLPADELEIVSRVQIEGIPQGMYLNGDRVTVISRLTSSIDPDWPIGPVWPISFADGPIASDSFYPYPFPHDTTTIVTVLDVSDRRAPQVVQRTTLEGDYSETRRIGDQVFLVLNSRDLLLKPELVASSDGSTRVYETEQQWLDRVNRDFSSLLQDVLPSYESYDSAGELVRGGPLVLPEDIDRSGLDASTMTVVVSLNMASSEPGLASASAVISSASSNIYATAEHLYVFSDQPGIGNASPSTHISKFDWDGQSGAIDFAASGSVPGTLLNQFSADEFEGSIRVVTEVSNTGSGNFSGRNETAMFVLEEDHGTLEFVGSLQNLALGQNVKSVRFFGDRVFVTTFQTIDPLYAIDLSDPTQPRVMGHVSITGFNSYMQFIAEDRLLTVGVNSANGLGGRAVVSLFDVGDLMSPRLIDRYHLPKFSISEANFDHHAFGWFASHEILAIPVSRHFQDRFDEDGDGYLEAIRAVQEDTLSMLHVGLDALQQREGISLRGEVEHNAKVQRSVRINDHVYSVGDDAIRSVKIANPSDMVGEVRFDDDANSVIPMTPRLGLDVSPLRHAARLELAASSGLNVGDIMFVTHETHHGESEVILRTGDRQYRYRIDAASEFELIESQFAFVEGWHNTTNALDVNADNDVTASDAFVIINELSRGLTTDLPTDRALRQVNVVPKFVDTNGDGRVTALDALIVINALYRQSAAPAAGEDMSANSGTGQASTGEANAEKGGTAVSGVRVKSASTLDAIYDEYGRRDSDDLRAVNSFLF